MLKIGKTLIKWSASGIKKEAPFDASFEIQIYD